MEMPVNESLTIDRIDKINIGPTALVIEHLRNITTNIRNSTRECWALRAREAYQHFGGNGNEAEFALMMEARYLAMDALIEESDIHQVFEIASGLSPRGANYIEDHPSHLYIETDANDAFIQAKARLTMPRTTRHIIQTLDATSQYKFEEASSQLETSQPVIVVSEGLLPYMDLAKIQSISRNIHSLLLKNGGVWITDIATKKGITKGIDFYTDHSGDLLRNLYQKSDISPEKMAFNKAIDAERFFQAMGFTIHKTKLNIAKTKISSPKATTIDEGKIDTILGQELIWTLRI